MKYLYCETINFFWIIILQMDIFRKIIKKNIFVKTALFNASLILALIISSCQKTDLNPNGAAFSDKGCLECDNYSVGESFEISGITYLVVNKQMIKDAINGVNTTNPSTGLAWVQEDLTKFCTSKVTNMQELFYEKPFNLNITSWDVSNVTNMEFMFRATTNFNQNIGNWDVSSVTNMGGMFSGAQKFNQNLNDWDVSNVANMASMFSGSGFNGNISSWDVNNVGSMLYMFSGCSFNGDIGSWDVGNITNIQGMFESNSVFNQDIGSWDVSNVLPFGFDRMFIYASTFNQDLSKWCVSQVPFLYINDSFAEFSGLDSANYPVWGTCP